MGEDNLEMPGLDSEAQVALSHGKGASNYPQSQSSWPQSSMSSGRGQSASPASSFGLDDMEPAEDYSGETGNGMHRNSFFLKISE